MSILKNVILVFIVARQFATWDIGHATIPMSRFSVIYVKRTEKTPKTTTVTFTFPDGQEDGLDDLTILKRLQDKIGLSLENATAYLEQYGKQLV